MINYEKKCCDIQIPVRGPQGIPGISIVLPGAKGPAGPPGSPGPTGKILNFGMFYGLTAGTVNPVGNSSALTITPANGSKTHANTQTLTILLINT